MRRTGRDILRGAMVAVMAALLAPGLLQAEGRFKKFDFKLPGEVTDVIMSDLDGDSLAEALAINIDRSKDPPVRRLTIFPQVKGVGFDPNKKIEWTFPAEVASIDVGDVTADPGRELVFITEHGVSAASVASGQVGPLKELFPVQSLVAIAYDRGVPYYNFVRDYTGDGKDDILVVGFSETLLARQKGDYEWIEEKLRLRPSMSIESFDIGRLMGDSEHPMYRVSYFVPQVFTEDYNGDKLPDLIVSGRRGIDVFLQSPKGFSSQPAKSAKIALYTDTGDRPGRSNPLSLTIRDLDGDGKAEVIANQSKGNLGSMQSRAVMFWGKDGSLDRGQPSLEFKCPHTITSVFIRDVNKDGLLDIIMPDMDLSAWTAGKAIVTGGFTVTWNFFLQKADRSFAAEPDRSFTTDLKFNIGKFELENGIPNVFGDFNGDGYPDQAVGESKDTLLISLRDQNGQLMGIDERVTVPVSMFNRALDVNRDGLSDLVIHYDERSEINHEFHILLNQGPWTKP
jgi:hypothetical protein